ncbi:hypothetical protein A2999_01425 [Candidatus Wolfebacteria bacterium RIFCSPLOWO2_01_FULL_38_11]|uniref:Uncharacterized protein n=2 Tax=Candidatus Wolfeibacteriota TaxID=1752735 RepID=A0A0G0J0F3_9BACT|nr:MAG: hypothetical protein US36_C0017G0024 [Candidatus Wolfebacteria bacterium GW2011_GWC1_37_10]OGM92121.1 MAG: hypothetical protein A2999_01425 [Candidatus Wolfebacteria bacterium RIFCSPLOWO2_01_FULL_38_11]
MNKVIKIILIVIIIILIAAFIGGIVYYRRILNRQHLKDEILNSPEAISFKINNFILQPRKKDFGSQLPPEFPKEIPIESGVKIEQSYGLNYQNQKQLSLVFQSEKTVLKNYDIYYDYLIKNNWNIINNHRGENISSLYASKESQKINITIFYDETSKKAKVSISVLER